MKWTDWVEWLEDVPASDRTTLEAIVEFEGSRLNGPLSDDMREFLTHGPARFVTTLRGWDFDVTPVRILSIPEIEELMSADIPEIPIIEGDGGNYFLVDEDGRIWAYWTELEDGGVVNDDIADFLQGLKPAE